jgi:DNA-nicking Smr family endonuclease
LQDLDAMRKKIADNTKVKELAEQARIAAEKRAEAERNLFTRAVGKVAPIANQERVWSPPQRLTPRPLQQDLDDEAVMHESMSDEFDISTLLDADDQLSFRRPGIGTDVTRKLRKGEWSIQGQIDLHGLRSDEARNAMGQFIRDAKRMGWRCVRVVHGKGLGSPGKEPVLKSKVQRWLVQKKEVLAFVQAKPSDGGGGALVVLLGPS